MGEKAFDLVNSIKKLLRNGPKSISEISTTLKINWRTAENYLGMLKSLEVVDEINDKNSRLFFFKENKNYFRLPVKIKHKKLISTIYAYTKEFCQEIYKREPTKTHIYKILWEINKKLNLKLPIGWYLYGPCCVQVYQGDEIRGDINPNTLSLLRETTKEYCCLDNIDLQRKIYKDEKNKLYLTKETLLKDHFSDKKEINSILMDLIKYCPREAIEEVTDFARATLLTEWNKTKDCFNILWKYITLIEFKNSLEFYYPKTIDRYFNKKINSEKKEFQLYIKNLVGSHVKAK